jgi:tRNA(Arg) A34 adenosine deaminase TadA
MTSEPARSSFPSFSLALPAWVGTMALPGDLPSGRDERMRLILRLARENVLRGTGGPFAAGVFEKGTGRLVAAGLNLSVPLHCSVAHAEMVAITLAQQALGTHDLSTPGLPPLELVSSAQPCCQCFGIVWWSGVTGLVVGARTEDVESIAGFDEGPLPDRWADRLRDRRGLPPIDVAIDVLRDEAADPLRLYRASGAAAYHPRGGPAAGT